MGDFLNSESKEAIDSRVKKTVPEILLPNDQEEDLGGGEEDEEEEDGEGEDWGEDADGKEDRKVKLVRSHAIRDSTSPPPPRQTTPQSPVGGVQVSGQPPMVITGDGSASDQRSIVSGSEGCEGALAELGDSVSVTDSGRGDTDTPDESQYTDSTGIDLTQFIISTLNKNSKDRMLMLKLETEMTSLVRDTKKSHHKFPQMSSYHRMLVHRVAAYFGLDHNVDQTGNCVIVNKTKTTRLPDMKFKDHVPEELILTTTSEPRRLILKRESCSCDSADRLSENSSRRSKSIEEREEEYERAKRRIFNDCTGKDVHMYSYKYPINLGSTKGQIQARSFDMRDSLRDSLDRPQVSKSFSFGGYPAAQPLEPNRQINPPKLSRGQVVWAVSDLGTVPKGAVLINPDTGTPFLNSDGSVYVFDPSNPPKLPGDDLITGGGPSPLHHHHHHHHATGASHHPNASPLLLQQELSKLSLDGVTAAAAAAAAVAGGGSGPAASGGGVAGSDKQQLVYSGGWMVPHPPRPTPYILVNPVSPLPQYLPYIYPAYQEAGGGATAGGGAPGGGAGPPEMALAQTSLPVLPGQANAASTVAAAGQPLPGVGGHPVVAAPPPTGPPMTGMGGPGPANHPGGPAVPIPPHVSTINHIPQNGLAENIQQGQFQLAGRPLLGAPVQKPFLFSIHRSPSLSVVFFLQHCPAILSRSQLVSMLEPFLSGRGHIQFLDPASQWMDVSTLPPETPTTNRYPIQIVFDSEEQATQTIAAFKSVGFLMEPQDVN